MMNKLARLKTIFRNNKPIDVVSDKLDDNSVDSINIVNQSIIPNKIKDESLTFDKMTDDTKFITTNNEICALRDVGGITIGEGIDNKSLKDLLKEIIIPYTKPSIGTVTYTASGDSHFQSGYTSTGSTISITKVIVPVMIKSENIVKVRIDINLNDSTNLYGNEITGSPIIGFLPNTFKNFEFSPNLSVTGTNIKDIITFKATVTDSQGGITEVASTKIIMLPYLYYGNSDKLFIYNGEPYLNTVNILNDLGTGIFNILNPDIYKNYGTTNSITYTYEKPVNQYSFMLLPSTSHIINSAIDQNGSTQNITYVGDAVINYFDNVNVNYRLFKTGISTMLDTLPRYTFNVINQ